MDPQSISEKLLFSTVRIEVTLKDGSVKTGTSFVVQIETDKGPLDFIVTNKHLIKDAEKGAMTFLFSANGKPTLGKFYNMFIPNFESIWVCHPDPNIDVCVAQLKPIFDVLVTPYGYSLYYTVITHDQFIYKADYDEIDALESIVFIGYPQGQFDKVNFTPIYRRGSTATPIILDYNGERKFLVDATVSKGSSGSPVFLYDIGGFSRKDGTFKPGRRIKFLGIIAKTICGKDNIDIVEDETISMADEDAAYKGKFKPELNLGIVFKALNIIDCIEKSLEISGTSYTPLNRPMV